MSELFIRNPHSILAALKSRPKEVLEITLPKDKKDDVWDEIEALAIQHRIRNGAGGAVQAAGRGGDPRRGTRGERSQPVAGGRESGHGALIKPKAAIAIEELFKGINENSRGVWLALDSLQDPQNVGAIFRAAAFFGIKGIILTSERSAPMTGTVYDIASGGVDSIPFVSIVNLQRAFEKAKDAGLWILGTSEHAKQSVKTMKNDRAWLLVMGNEEKGLRRLTEESCDMMCTIPNAGGGVTSLNVAVATGILLSHLT